MQSLNVFLAITAALISSVLAGGAGTAYVKSNCQEDIFLWSVADSAGASMVVLNAGNNMYSEPYRTNDNGGGISIKLAKVNTQVNVTQFEYTMGNDGNVYYDLSIIDGIGLQQEGMDLVPSDSSCPSVICPAGVTCTAAYINPDDNYATKGCRISTDLTLTLCPGGSGPAPAAPAAPASSSSAPPPPPSSTSAPPPSSTSVAPSSTVAPASSSTVPSSSSVAAAPVEMFEKPTSTPEAVTWHSVSKRRGHAHGHRFARP